MSDPGGSAFDLGADEYEAFVDGARGRERTEAAWESLQPHLPAAGIALDAGGGLGPIAARLVRAGLAVVLLDRAAWMLRAASRRLGSRCAPLARVRARIERPPFPPSSFDVVVCHAVLEYVPGWRPGLAELAALVSPGGVLSVEALRAGVPGDFEPDDVFRVPRRGLSSEEVHRAMRSCGLAAAAARTTERRVHLVGRRPG